MLLPVTRCLNCIILLRYVFGRKPRIYRLLESSLKHFDDFEKKLNVHIHVRVMLQEHVQVEGLV